AVAPCPGRLPKTNGCPSCAPAGPRTVCATVSLVVAVANGLTTEIGWPGHSSALAACATAMAVTHATAAHSLLIRPMWFPSCEYPIGVIAINKERIKPDLRGEGIAAEISHIASLREKFGHRSSPSAGLISRFFRAPEGMQSDFRQAVKAHSYNR